MKKEQCTLPHDISIVVWNEFIAKTSNQGIDFSFDDLEKRIYETICTVIDDTNP